MRKAHAIGIAHAVIMPTPVKRKVASSADNVSVPTGGKNEVDGGETESLALTPKSNDSVIA